MIIENKVAIVTGASGGIGLSCARLLSAKGARVALVARSTQKLQEISTSLPNSFVVTADMTKPEQIKKMVDDVYNHYGKIDILVNNAGRGYDSAITEIEIEKFTNLFLLNVLGPLIAMQKVYPIMKKNGQGAIVNISSGTSFMSIPGIGAYSATKRALNGLSLTAYEELKNENIKVSLVYPFITSSDFYKNKLSPQHQGDKKRYMEGDSPEFVAEKIISAIESGKKEIFAHDWMENN